MEFILEIYSIIIELSQYLFDIPEGISYALFGIKKKKKKAKKALRKAETQISSAMKSANLDSIPNPSSPNAPRTETIDGNSISGLDLPSVPFKPEYPYRGKQIILNSGRLHLNANSDFILLNSKKSISLGAPGSINIDTDGGFIVNAGKIKLGIGDASEEPLVKGNVLNQIITLLNIGLQNAANGLKNAEDAAGRKILGCEIAAEDLQSAAKQMDSLRTSLLSKQNFTK